MVSRRRRDCEELLAVGNPAVVFAPRHFRRIGRDAGGRQDHPAQFEPPCRALAFQHEPLAARGIAIVRRRPLAAIAPTGCASVIVGSRPLISVDHVRTIGDVAGGGKRWRPTNS